MLYHSGPGSCWVPHLLRGTPVLSHRPSACICAIDCTGTGGQKQSKHTPLKEARRALRVPVRGKVVVRAAHSSSSAFACNARPHTAAGLALHLWPRQTACRQAAMPGRPRPRRRARHVQSGGAARVRSCARRGALLSPKSIFRFRKLSKSRGNLQLLSSNTK